MLFSEIFTASLLATTAAAHGSSIPGAPKIVGSSDRDIAALKARNILGSRRVTHQPHNAKVQARQGGDVNGRCGKEFGCATCATGYCCSSGGWCGQGPEYCQAPDSQFEYGPAADANQVPPSGSTLNTARTKVGSVAYGGEGIYVCTKPGQIAITYDDGPYSYTGKVLDLFKSYNFKATFFITGINLSKGRIDDSSTAWPALISRMLSEGHQLASHTWSHQDLSAITKAQRYDQMVRLEMAMTNIVGKFPTYMRPPYSSCSAASGCPTDMADLGYHISYFDLDTDDYNNITPELQQNAKDRFYNAVNPSSSTTDEFLGIAHDIHYQTAYNLTGYMLDLMSKKGYTGVTMGECLGDPEANWYRTPSARTASTSSFSAPACASTASSASRSGSASATSSGAVATPTGVSQDSSCGPAVGLTCLGFSGGECCSQYNYCGSTEGHCGTGCQAGFGKCGLTSGSSSAAVSSSVATSSSARASSSLAASTRTSSSVSPSATPAKVVSTDATCAGTNGFTCAGSEFGDCCSQYGWCGSTDAHCGTGCNSLFGKCGSLSASSSNVAASSSAGASSSTISSSVRSSSAAASSSPSSSKPASSSPSSSKPASSSPSSSKPASSSASSSKPASSSASSSKPASSSASSSKPASSSPSSSKPASSSPSSSKSASSSPVSSSRAASSFPASSSPASSSKPASTSTKLASSSTRSSSASASATLKVSTDGTCGGSTGFTCLTYYEGTCCSQYGYCGKTKSYCGTGCQKGFGTCT